MPIQRLTFSFALFFPIEKTKAVLQRIGKLGGETSERRTELLYRGEGIVMPFSSWYGDRRIRLQPGTEARFYAYLRFPVDNALRAYGRCYDFKIPQTVLNRQNDGIVPDHRHGALNFAPALRRRPEEGNIKRAGP